MRPWIFCQLSVWGWRSFSAWQNTTDKHLFLQAFHVHEFKAGNSFSLPEKRAEETHRDGLCGKLSGM